MLNPDIAGAGGVLEFLEIAAMAKAFAVGVSPHCYNSMSLGLVAMRQVSALLPNLVWTEYFPATQAASDAIAVTDIRIENGAATLPSGPGLGALPDESKLRPLHPT